MKIWAVLHWASLNIYELADVLSEQDVGAHVPQHGHNFLLYICSSNGLTDDSNIFIRGNGNIGCII